MAVQLMLLDAEPPQPTTGAECRVSERHTCDLQASCQPIAARADKDLMWPATVRDISVSGVGLVLARRFERGAGLAIEIPATATTAPESILARVVHATALPEGFWLLGCAFPSHLSDDELQALMRLADVLKHPRQSATPAADRSPTPGEGPSSARTTPNPAKTFVVPSVMFETITEAGVPLRLLVKALRLTGAWPPPAGTTLKVWLGPKGVNTAATKLVVEDCSRREEHWMVHCSFAEKPSAEVLRAFGRRRA